MHLSRLKKCIFKTQKVLAKQNIQIVLRLFIAIILSIVDCTIYASQLRYLYVLNCYISRARYSTRF